MESNLLDGGDFEKFLVIKTEDYKKLPEAQRAELARIFDSIGRIRKAEKKRMFNQYFVINVDEPYAPKIVNILKANGHWG